VPRIDHAFVAVAMHGHMLELRQRAYRELVREMGVGGGDAAHPAQQ